jgi:hypothetical protein
MKMPQPGQYNAIHLSQKTKNAKEGQKRKASSFLFIGLFLFMKETGRTKDGN